MKKWMLAAAVALPVELGQRGARPGAPRRPRPSAGRTWTVVGTYGGVMAPRAIRAAA